MFGPLNLFVMRKTGMGTSQCNNTFTLMERRMSTKVSCTVWTRGKDGDNFKFLPIGIRKDARNSRQDLPSKLEISNCCNFTTLVEIEPDNHHKKIEPS